MSVKDEDLYKRNKISISDGAKERLIDLLRDRNDIRLMLIDKGCGGKTFRFDFSDAEISDVVVELGAERRLAISPECPTELSIDWIEGIEPHFMFDSPAIVSKCGCGSSFKIAQ